MICDFATEYLAKQGFVPVAKQINKVNFYLKEDGETLNICAIINMFDGWSISYELLADNVKQMERRFYLRGYKQIDTMYIIFTDDIDGSKCLAEGEVRCWLADPDEGKLIIYENQPEDYFGIRSGLENALYSSVSNKRFGIRDIPVVSIALIAINVLVFMILEQIGDTENPAFMLKYGASSWEMVFVSGQYYRLFTAMFLHFGAEHLITNMFMLGVIGCNLEKDMGRLKYLAIYVVSGLVGSACSALFYMAYNEPAISAGASGAIYGLLGALVMTMIKSRKKVSKGMGIKMVFVVFVLTFGSVTSDGIDFMAHIAGLIAGLILGFIIYTPRRVNIY